MYIGMSINRTLQLLLFLNLISSSVCVLPAYTPALNKDGEVDDSVRRDDVITSYFKQGFTNAEIAGFLILKHGIVISVRTIKRILRRLKLKRARHDNESPLREIVSAIVEEVENSSGGFMGYRQLTRRLRRKYNLQVRRDTIMNAVRIIDPDGVERRKRRRLKRRRYATPGPNFIWHVDGWDKLAPYGIYVHGAIDGYSRRILWLEANSTNKNPKVVASHFLDTVNELGGVPRRIRCDKGTENTVIAQLQQFFRWYDSDDFGGNQSFVVGKSSGNQRIEAWWSKLRDGGGGWWINLFKDLRDSGLYGEGILSTELLKFCFLPILQKELHLVGELWNTHNIARQKRGELEGGKPDVMFFTPEIYGTHEFLVRVNAEDVKTCKQLYAEDCEDYNEEIEELVRLIKPDYIQPSNEAQALKLFCDIAAYLKNR